MSGYKPYTSAGDINPQNLLVKHALVFAPDITGNVTFSVYLLLIHASVFTIKSDKDLKSQDRLSMNIKLVFIRSCYTSDEGSQPLFFVITLLHFTKGVKKCITCLHTGVILNIFKET